jgi:hypothetical protein
VSELIDEIQDRDRASEVGDTLGGHDRVSLEAVMVWVGTST